MTHTVLKIVLAALVVSAVVFALKTIVRTRELRSLSMQATMANNNLLRIQSLYNDTLAYSQKNPSPDLTHILQGLQAKPAAATH